MVDSFIEFFSLAIAIVAFIFARKVFNQVAALRARVDSLEASAASVAAFKSAPPPLPASAPAVGWLGASRAAAATVRPASVSAAPAPASALAAIARV